MQSQLIQSNKDLTHQITRLQELLGQAKIPGVLTGYRSEIESHCERLRQQARRNLKDLSYGQRDVQENVLRQTQRVMNELEVLNHLYAGPLLRSQEADKLTLTVLRWLHDEHAKTASRSFALSDGQFAICPHADLPTVYFLPCSRQKTLLYLPLLFHEFGHLLYALHRPELNELVEEFQGKVYDVLAPMTVRSGPAAEQQTNFRLEVVQVYYEWLQEFFCDAVGLQIGGPSYLEAFTNYFRLLGSREFFVPRDEQVVRSHPVGWLRVRSLVHRGRRLGLNEIVDRIEATWNHTAKLMRISEDYEGTWSEELFSPLQQTLDDMIVETAPRPFQDNEVNGDNSVNSLVSVLNGAWAAFVADPDEYVSSEDQWKNKILRSP